MLDRIRAAGLNLKPLKCSLFCDKSLYLGHVISVAGVSPNPAKLRVLAEWPVPTTVREMKSFFGFINFYRDFIACNTELTAPLYDLTAARKGEDPIQLNTDKNKAFAEIKLRLCAAPSLRI